MADGQRLYQLSESDLDWLMADLIRLKTSELILIGPGITIPDAPDKWPKSWQNVQAVYQLRNQAHGLAERLASLEQLNSLTLWNNVIGDKDILSLASLTQLSSLDLTLNKITNAGVVHLALLTRLTSLNLGYNLIGEAGVKSLGALESLIYLNLWGNRIGKMGAASVASLNQLRSLDLTGNFICDEGAASLAVLENLTSLNLQNNRIGDQGAASLSNLKKLSSLNLGHNQVGVAGASSIATITSLNSLNLENNGIGDAGAVSLAPLTKLSYLNLSGNGIRDAGLVSLGSLVELSSLNLAGNSITDTGVSSLTPLAQLTSLNLLGNRIGDEGVGSLKRLTKLSYLNLQNNRIGKQGAESLATLESLNYLNLAGNKIGDSGLASLASLVQLKSLNLASNGISADGAAYLQNLINLTYLDLAGNKIGDEGLTSLASLRQLTSLNLWGNNITHSQAHSLWNLKRLVSLNLGYNRIGSLGAKYISVLKLLTSLDLWGNDIGDAGVSHLAVLTNLKSLNLACNGIGDMGVTFLLPLSQLTSLNLWGNNIGDVGATSLTSLSQLISLNLQGNKICDISTFVSLSQLSSLNLAKNNVQDLSPLKLLLQKGLQVTWKEFGSNGINVYGCPLVHPPPEIVQQGNQAILNYLQEIEDQGVDHLYEAKVLIVGEGGAGKTSLLRRLYCSDLDLPDEKESTRGIDIHRHEFVGEDGTLFRLNVWDFGGQEIYHATHQFFLTKRSLYILVDDTKNNSKTVHDEGFKYWLEVIEAFSDCCPVLIFQNEKAGRSKPIDEPGIKGRFANVMEIYRGNLEHIDAARPLSDAIRVHVQKLPHVGDAVPAQWVAIRSMIEMMKQKKPYITIREYFKLYGCFLPEDNTKALLLSHYFHDLGVFLHFQDDPLLSRTVILQNEWATEAVFRVLNDEPTKKRRGFFTLSDCRRIWADSAYEDMHPELLTLMQRFELCYKLPEQNPETWLTPQLLLPSIPGEFKEWAQADDLVLTYQYDFLPKGIISRLMVRMHRFVREPDRSWGSGAYFEHGLNQLLASVTSIMGQEIELRARGPERKALLSVVASDLDALNASYEGLHGKVRKLVPCICSRCRLSIRPERFDESKLLKRKQHNVLTVQCDDSFEHINVLQLLDGLRTEHLTQWPESTGDDSPFIDKKSLSNLQEFDLPFQKIIKIFLASSSELRSDCNSFELYLRQENDRLSKQGVYLQINRWENFLDAISETSLQSEYNKDVRNCDIFLSLFKTSTGKFTEEEFDVAFTSFKEHGKPYIFTYFMDAEITIGSMTDEVITLFSFKKRLRDLGHYPTEYKSIHDLKLQFKRQLERLIDEGRL